MPRHDLDVVSLIAGMVFGGGAVVYLVDGTWDGSGRWLWPLLLIAAGVVGLLTTRAKGSDGTP